MRVDLVEPYYGGSHRAWVDGLVAHCGHVIEPVTMPAHAWRWRMRGAAATLAPALVARATEVGPPGVLVASDMVDLADLLARVRTTHRDVPTALYLHENQLTYPRRPGEPLDVGLAWITWRNLTIADEVWCNSAFHRDELLAGLPPFLEAVPDHDQLGLLDEVAAKLRVIPVGVDLPAFVPGPRPTPPLVVSNQRWHHDKDVGAVVRAMVRLSDDGIEFRVAVVGDHTGGHADEIGPLLDRLGDRVVARGHQDRAAYLRLLGEAEVVVSAARNEFYGIAVIEAVAAGAVPVLPAAVAYPEIMPASVHDLVLYPPGSLGTALRAAITDAPARRERAEGLAGAMAIHDWAVVAPRYDDELTRLAASRTRGAD